MITLEDLAAIPIEYRTAIARWIDERGRTLKPSMVLSPHSLDAVQIVLTGMAVDLAAPLAEDSTVDHANAILSGLREKVCLCYCGTGRAHEAGSGYHCGKAAGS